MSARKQIVIEQGATFTMSFVVLDEACEPYAMDFGDWLGSVWFALLLGVVGYVADNLFPIGKIFKK